MCRKEKGRKGKTLVSHFKILMATDTYLSEPKRLFQSTSRTLPPSKSLSAMPAIQDRSKTPATSHRAAPLKQLRTPAPARMEEPPAPTPLPSATRTRRRSRQSISLIGPSITPVRPTAESFQTPAAGGRWEEEASLGSITEVLEGIELNVMGLEGVKEEEDEEVEYMPPRAVGECLHHELCE